MMRAEKAWLALASLLGAGLAANGLYMLASPAAWYFAVPGVTTTGPFNQHFVRDIGLIFVLIGAAFLLGVARPVLRLTLWGGAALWLAGHALFHVWEVAVGICGTSALARDFPAVTLPALIAIALTVWSARNVTSAPSASSYQQAHTSRAGRRPMTQRIAAPYAFAPAAIKAMYALEHSFESSGLDPVLRELVKLRASQINGCAFCIHMHTTDLRKQGEPEMRLYMLDAWRESTLYSDRERAALGWTEALTRLAETHAPDADYALLKAQFTEAEQVQLTLLIGAINTWNRFSVGLRVAHPVDASHAAA